MENFASNARTAATAESVFQSIQTRTREKKYPHLRQEVQCHLYCLDTGKARHRSNWLQESQKTRGTVIGTQTHAAIFLGVETACVSPLVRTPWFVRTFESNDCIKTICSTAFLIDICTCVPVTKFLALVSEMKKIRALMASQGTKGLVVRPQIHAAVGTSRTATSVPDVKKTGTKLVTVPVNYVSALNHKN